MNEDKEVTVTVTPEDAEFRARAVAAGVPSILISMYGKSLRRLIADEREACAFLCDEMERKSEWTDCCKWPTPADCAYVIRARGKE
jgi:hypothetical protein